MKGSHGAVSDLHTAAPDYIDAICISRTSRPGQTEAHEVEGDIIGGNGDGVASAAVVQVAAQEIETGLLMVRRVAGSRQFLVAAGFSLRCTGWKACATN